MNIVFSLVHLMTFYSFILLVRAQADEFPLVFNPYTSEVYIDIEAQLNSEDNHSYNYPDVLAACPARNEEEKEVNENQSLYKKALFVREFYAKGVKLDEMIRCENNFELAVAVIPRTSRPMNLRFGYEVYFEESVIPEDAKDRIKTSKHTAYDTIFRNRELPFLLRLKGDKHKSLQFVWLESFAIIFNDALLNVEGITYSVHRNADKMNLICNDNNLGNQIYTERSVDLDKYYTTGNQINIFNGFEIPKQSTCLSAPNRCLEKYNLLMPHHFQSSPSSIISCSDLTSIPIWHEVNKKLLDYSEKFLIAISEITNGKLTVTSGVYEMLSLRYKNPTTGKTELKNIYLDNYYRRIPVPRVIYKIVTYQSHDCENRIVDLCFFDMVIVIHNEPEIKGEKLCKRDECKKWGWQNMQYLSTEKKSVFEKKSSYIYCCELNPSLRLLLGYNAYYTRKDLNLKVFPYEYNANKKKILFKNMQAEFEKKMKDLFNQ